MEKDTQGKNMILKSLRVLHGLGQKEMGALIGTSKCVYNVKENGKRPFSLKEARIISEKLGKSVEEIFFQ